MIKIELLETLTSSAKTFLNGMTASERVNASVLLADYINHIADNQCVDYALRASDLVCSRCSGTGINHGVQVPPSRKYPTGWKSEPCDRCGQSAKE